MLCDWCGQYHNVVTGCGMMFTACRRASCCCCRYDEGRGWQHARTGNHRVLPGQEAGVAFGGWSGRNDPQSGRHHSSTTKVIQISYGVVYTIVLSKCTLWDLVQDRACYYMVFGMDKTKWNNWVFFAVHLCVFVHEEVSPLFILLFTKFLVYGYIFSRTKLPTSLWLSGSNVP